MKVIEVHDSKLEHLCEYAEKVVKYGKHLIECLEEMGGEHYEERYGKRHPYGFRHDPEEHMFKEYPRYY